MILAANDFLMFQRIFPIYAHSLENPKLPFLFLGCSLHISSYFHFDDQCNVTVCQKCGATGFSEFLIFCNDCHLAAEHRYCLDKLPSNDEVIWVCEGCRHKASKSVSLDKLGLYSWLKKKHRGGLRRIKKKVDEKRNEGVKYSTISTEANAKMSCSVDAHDNLELLGDPSLLNDESKCVHSSSENTAGGGKIKKQRRRLILDVDVADQELECVKVDQNSSCQVKNNQNAGERNQLSGFVRSENAANGPASHLARARGPDAEQTNPGAYDTLSDKSCHQSHDDYNSYVHAQPMIKAAWRGCFDIHKHYYGMVAHLSNLACLRVYEGVKMLLPTLSLEKLPRVETWPRSFQRSPPTDENIGLYFFPESERVEKVYNQLLDDINEKDRALRVIFGDVELLIFSSLLLPPQQSSFNGKYYLWGVFRSVPRQHGLDDCNCIKKSAAKQSSSMLNADEVTKSASKSEQVEKIQGNFKRRSFTMIDDRDNDELELFPLDGEDMAVTVKTGGHRALDLDLGLGQSFSKNGKGSPGCKLNGGGADGSLTMDRTMLLL